MHAKNGLRNLAYQRSFIDDLAKKLKLTSNEGWYKIQWATLKQNGAYKLLKQYDHIPSKLITAVYPEYYHLLVLLIFNRYKWDISKFVYPPSYWHDLPQQRKFMNDLAEKLNISSTEDWYRVTAKTIQTHGGSGLLDRYENSPSKLLSTLYPEYKNSCKEFLISIAREWKLSNIADLQNIPPKYLKSQQYGSLLGRHFKDRQPHLLRQHRYSVTKCTCSYFKLSYIYYIQIVVNYSSRTENK